MSKKFLLATVVAFVPSFALAFDPVGGGGYNVASTVDLTALTPETFESSLLPVALTQGTIVFYDFTESFKPLFADNLIPAFEAKYPGIKVGYYPVNGETAVQQLIAAKEAGQPSPVDVFFMPNGQVRVSNEAGVIANLPLNAMLPAAPDLAEQAATVSRGYVHGGVVVPYHRNQTAIGYDTRAIAATDVPLTFADLLVWAKANPGKFAMTSPAKGGSGGGFLESAILALASDDCVAQAKDFSLTPDQAKAWAAGPCLEPVMTYFNDFKGSVEITNGNTDTLTLIANGVATVGTVWEDQTFDYIGRGLLPPSVRVTLLESGLVGDGDGIMIPSGTERVEAALIFVNWLMSDEAQVAKTSLNGSRTARTGLDLAGAVSAEMADRLIPTAVFQERSRARIAGVVSSAATDRFVADVLQQ
jgi:putative spermidine/putrescine transport system substrate-binding protein